MNVLLTGFGPFPGAPHNPTGPLVTTLARIAHPGVRRKAHVFRTSYAAVDSELPALLTRERPDVLIMFGLAARTRHLRIETVARNALSIIVPDVTGTLPQAETIALSGVEAVPLPAPAKRLVAAARAAGVPTILSRDAGSYLCNYLCWRACEAAFKPGGPRLAAFVHVPLVAGLRRGRARGTALTVAELVRAGEAIVMAATATARTSR